MCKRQVDRHGVAGVLRIEGNGLRLVLCGAIPAESHGGVVVPPALVYDNLSLGVNDGVLSVTLGFCKGELSVRVQGRGSCAEDGRRRGVRTQIDTVSCLCDDDRIVGAGDVPGAYAPAGSRMHVVTAHQEGSVTVVNVDIVGIGFVRKDDIAAKGVKRYMEGVKCSVEVRSTVIALTRPANVYFQISASCGISSRVDDLELWTE